MNNLYNNAIVGNVTATQIGHDTPGLDAKWQKLIGGLPGTYFLVTEQNVGSGFGIIMREELFNDNFNVVREPANT